MRRTLESLSHEGFDLPYDLYRPQGVENPPLVLLIHGGGWVAGNKDNMTILAEVVCEAGMAAACISYRLAPKFPFPAAISDVAATADHLSKEWGSRVGCWGISAGAHLALTLANTSKVACAVSFCALTDLVDYRTHYPRYSHEFIQLFLENKAENERPASPLYQVSASTASTLMVHGKRDDLVPVEQGRKLAEAYQQHGVEHEYIELAYEGHSFSFEAWPEVEAKAIAFLKTHLQ